MAMQSGVVYLVVDYDGFRVVVTEGGAQMTLAGPSLRLEEVLVQAMQVRGGPIAFALTSC